MKQILFLFAVISVCCYELNAQNILKRTIKNPILSKVLITDAKIYFPSFTAMKENPQRGEFETESEYQKRMSKKIDTTTNPLFYVSVPPAYQSKNYQYKIESNLLTISGGRLQNYESDYDRPTNTIPIIIQIEDLDKGSYMATNAFGQSVLVKKTHTYHYVVNFTNLDFIPDSIFDRENNTFRFSIYISPKEAERLSKSSTIVAVVKPISYQRSNLECVSSTQPKITSPYESAIFNYSFDARMVRLFLFDKSAKKILSEYIVRDDSSVIYQRKANLLQKDSSNSIQQSEMNATDSDDVPPADYVDYEKEPSVLKKVEPVYPNLAMKAGLEGTVYLKVWVDKKGKVQKSGCSKK